MRYLLDANALIALCWSSHQHHESAIRWFSAHNTQGWSTCAFTQAAFVRVSLQPVFSGQAVSSSDIVEVLRLNTSQAQHSYLPIDFDMCQVYSACTGGIAGHRQVTDAWLLTAAIKHHAKLVSFDSGIASLLATTSERAAHLHLLK